jgi:hypothetical protein
MDKLQFVQQHNMSENIIMNVIWFECE